MQNTDVICNDPVLSFVDPDGLNLNLVFILQDERKGIALGSVKRIGDLFSIDVEKMHSASFYFREDRGILIELILEKKNREKSRSTANSSKLS